MLYIIATPIGNLEDITLRALRILKEVDFILAEDTRKTAVLLKHFGIKKQLVSLFEHNEVKRTPEIIAQLKQGKNIALVSNAGTPGISDPGYKLIRACRQENLNLTSLPGPCSITNAIALTSLPHEKFIFWGYIPRKRGQRQKLFEEIKAINITAVLLESPFRLLASLKQMREVLGNPQVAVMREMTKKFEEVKETSLEEAASFFEKTIPRGEFVLLISPA